MSKNFRERLAAPIHKRRTNSDIAKELEAKYKLLTSEKSIEFTQCVINTIGKVVEEEFPGVKFMLKARVKSFDSYDTKKEKILKRDRNKDKKIYDTIGCCLVIENIPFDARIEHALCRKHLTGRGKIATQIEETKLKLKKIINEYSELEKYEEEELKNQEIELEELKAESQEKYESKKQRVENLKSLINKEKNSHATHVQEIEDLIKSYKEIYEMEDNSANNALARHILNKIINSEEISKELGITRIPNRSKVHDGGKSGLYIACHDSLQSSKFEGWILEIQSMAYQNYRESREGGARHSNCEGKERVLPPIGETESENEKFKQAVLKNTPKNFVYQSKRVDDEGNVIGGQCIYVCSEVENFVYHYLEALEGKPELFAKIRSAGFFSDKYEVKDSYNIDL